MMNSDFNTSSFSPEYDPEGVKQEYKPSVRIKKRSEPLRQKLRIRDLAPEKKYIKDVSGNELKYFLLLTFPVAVTAFVIIAQREGLVQRLISILASFLGGGN